MHCVRHERSQGGGGTDLSRQRLKLYTSGYLTFTARLHVSILLLFIFFALHYGEVWLHIRYPTVEKLAAGLEREKYVTVMLCTQTLPQKV